MHPSGANAEGMCVVPQGVSLAVYGAPCPPYSKMRAKRTVDGSVRQHAGYDVMFSDTVQWLQKHEPAVAIAEQVCGFDSPESVNVSETPLQRS